MKITQYKKKIKKKLNHITNKTSYIITNKQNCANEKLVSNSDMHNFSTISKVDSIIFKNSLKKILKNYVCILI